ncbi:MAG: hypothetical protein WCA27_07345 [Candidatus Sulfotelmatobacter sp.]
MNLINQTFGCLHVLRLGTPRGKRAYWLCRCEARYGGKLCGVVKEVRADALRAPNGTRSCGCLQRESVRARGHHHARGERFSHLVIIKQVGSIPKRGRVYMCLCDCGKRIKVQGRFLRDGLIKSCGCWYRATRTTSIKHGQCRTTRKTPVYNAYQRQKHQCRNPHSRQARYFHDKGIEFRFCSFAEFYAEVGDKPNDDCWLVRIDGDGHFQPGNLEWKPVKRHKCKRKPR